MAPKQAAELTNIARGTAAIVEELRSVSSILKDWISGLAEPDKTSLKAIRRVAGDPSEVDKEGILYRILLKLSDLADAGVLKPGLVNFHWGGDMDGVPVVQAMSVGELHNGALP